MRITKTQLKSLIKEELEQVLSEGLVDKFFSQAQEEVAGLENIPAESREMFLPGKLLHTFINDPANEGVTPSIALKLFNKAFTELGRNRELRRDLAMKHKEARAQGVSAEETPMMQWIANKMQEYLR